MARRPLLLLLIVGFLTGLTLPRVDASPQDDSEYYELMSVLVDTLDQVERNYVKPLERRELLEAAIRGVLTKLDPYSSYISPEDIGRFKTSVESKFGGIGIQITMDRGQLKVLSPLVGTPAYEAGLLAGDKIVEIEGESTEGIDLSGAVDRLKGEPDSKVTLTVVHGNSIEPLEVTITRKIIRVPTVMGDKRKEDDSWNYMIDGERKIGYIRLTAFSRETPAELRRALDELEDAGLKALVLDLRFNPGGLLTAAIEISDMFISSGRIVSTSGRNSSERVWDAHKEGTYEGFPMAILVNHYSASASEIVSACLQDHDRAVIVGERTWGKGSVQNVIELEGGKSALKLTTASYQRPSGKNIHRFPDASDEDEWGVMPNEDQLIELTGIELAQLVEYRRQRDIVAAHLPPPNEGAEPSNIPDGEAETKIDDEKPDAKPDAKTDDDKPEAKPEAQEDPSKEQSSVAEEPAKDESKQPAEVEPAEPPKGESDEPKPAETKASDEANAESDDAEKEAKEDAPFVDRQLQVALDYLIAKLMEQE